VTPEEASLGLIGMIAAVAVYVTYRVGKGKLRRVLLASEADKLGFSFSPRAQNAANEWEPIIKSYGHGQRVLNVMKGSEGNADIAVLDLHSRTGIGQSSYVDRLTLCIVRCQELSLPKFSLRRRRMLPNRIVLPAETRIEIDEDSEFSRSFELWGEDEAAVRDFMSPAVRKWFSTHTNLKYRVEGDADTMVLYCERTLAPRDVAQAVDVVTGVVERRLSCPE